MDDRRPPHIVPNDTVCSGELVPTDVWLVTQNTGQHIGTDGELSPHVLHQRVVPLLIWRVCELHVQGLQDLVKRTCGVCDAAGGEEEERCVCVHACGRSVLSNGG